MTFRETAGWPLAEMSDGANAQAWLREADRLHQDRQFTQSVEHYRGALIRDPSLLEAWYGLGCAQQSVGEHGEAIAALRGALSLRPDAARLRIHLAESLFALGHVSGAVREYQRAAADGDHETRAMATGNIACIAPGDPAMDNAAILQARRTWADAEAEGVRPIRPMATPGARLRVGYYGTFFGSANWMKLYMGVINAHDRGAFEVHLIADGALPAAEAGYQDYPDDRVWQVDGLSNHDLARLIAEARLDVLVDLNGYSHQRRMGLLAHRAAPVQIAWLGMYGTTGFAAVDCVISDAASLPPEEEQFCVERVRRVPHTYLAFDMFYPVPDVAPPPFPDAGHVTFGSLVSAYKITDAVIGSWSRTLRGVPGSRLLLRNRMLGNQSNQADLLARFAANGIDAAHLTLEGGGPHQEFLRTYDRIDIALDSFPYSGATTTAEAIWQGVPVLTYNGDRWAARTSRSILLAAGLDGWVAPDQPAFEALAIRLGRAPERLAEIRPGLRAKAAASPVCDTVGLCRALEAIYREERAARL
jgi:protein O-GlcNAc transferase